MRNQVGPSGPHPGTRDLGPHSAPAERWNMRAGEGDFKPVTHISGPQLSPLSQPHRVAGGGGTTELAVL